TKGFAAEYQSSVAHRPRQALSLAFLGRGWRCAATTVDSASAMDNTQPRDSSKAVARFVSRIGRRIKMSVVGGMTQPGPRQASPVHTRAVIIGTGFSGLGMAIALQKAGLDFLILEKADDVGGTWRDNSYPGCACDIPSNLYSFSFETKSNWKHPYALRDEIWNYLKGV